MTIRGLSLWQPWANAVAGGRKRIETRGPRFPRSARSLVIVVHAAKKVDPEPPRALRDEILEPRGAFLGIAMVTGFRVYRSLEEWKTDEMLHLCPPEYWEPGKIGLLITGTHGFPEPIPGRGMLGLFPVPAKVEAAALEALREAKF